MRVKIQSMKKLRGEMFSVVEGRRKAPADAGKISFDSIEAVLRLLTWPTQSGSRRIRKGHAQRQR